MQITEPTPKDLELARSAVFQDRIAMAIGIVGFGLIPIAVIIVAWGGYRWLQNGYWPPANWVTAFDSFGIPYPMTKAIGLQRIIDWFMTLSLWTLPVVLALVCLLIMNVLASLESKEGNAARAKIATWERHQERLKKQDK